MEIFIWGELIDPPSFHRKAHFIYYDLHCKVISGEVKLEERELSEYQWIRPEEALKLELGEAFSEVITKFIEYRNVKDKTN